MAGRGRQGRAWTSERGNLYASLMLRDPAPADKLGQMPLMVAIAVHDAVADVLPPFARGDLAIKWPNDLLLGGAKIVGILIEGSASRAGQVVVVGIGINCAHHPEDTPIRRPISPPPAIPWPRTRCSSDSRSDGDPARAVAGRAF